MLTDLLHAAGTRRPLHPAPAPSFSRSATPHLVLLPPPAAAAAVVEEASSGQHRREGASQQQQQGPSPTSTTSASQQEYAGATFSRDPTHSWVAQAVPSIVKCLTEQRALLERTCADSMRPLTPMVEWVYSRPGTGSLAFQAQQLSPEQWDPKVRARWGSVGPTAVTG